MTMKKKKQWSKRAVFSMLEWQLLEMFNMRVIFPFLGRNGILEGKMRSINKLSQIQI